jgi:hypothetical protein
MIQAPLGYESAESPCFQGESDEDRAALLILYFRFRNFNEALDGSALCRAFEMATRGTSFSTETATPTMASTTGSPLGPWLHSRNDSRWLGRIHITIRGDMERCRRSRRTLENP